MFSFGLFSSVTPFMVMIAVYLLGLFTCMHPNFFRNSETEITAEKNDTLVLNREKHSTPENTFPLSQYVATRNVGNSNKNPTHLTLYKVFPGNDCHITQPGIGRNIASRPPPAA